MKDIEQVARGFAEGAHGDQKYGKKPYVTHLAAVRAVLGEFGFKDENLRVASWLHDVLEDTKITPAQLELAFGSTVTHLVWAVTGIGKNRKERTENAYDKMTDYPRAIPLKLADRIANGRASVKDNPSLLAMYRKEYAGFRAKLYRLSEEEEAPMWAELDRLFK